MTHQAQFDFSQAFSRNLGWITEGESKILKDKKIAIAGMGGVGGLHLLTHVRLGVSHFHIADFDTFEMVNFNRQTGASISHLGMPKVKVLENLAKDINPDLDIKTFEQGLDEENMHAFFEGCDVFIDGLDIFALDIRQKAFQYCYEHGIPAITAAPLGLGVSMLVFLPGKTSFEQYFRFSNLPPEEKILRFLTGLSPFALHRKALVDKTKVQLSLKKGPSLAIGCEFCAAMAASTTIKLCLNRGKVLSAPHAIHFDAYTHTKKVSWRPFGAYHPLQYIQRFFLKRLLKSNE